MYGERRRCMRCAARLAARWACGYGLGVLDSGFGIGLGPHIPSVSTSPSMSLPSCIPARARAQLMPPSRSRKMYIIHIRLLCIRPSIHTHIRGPALFLSFIYPFSLLSLFSYLILSFPISSLDMNHSPTRIVHIPLHPPPPSISTSVPPHSIPP